MSKSKSKLIFLHSVQNKKIHNGQVIIHEEEIKQNDSVVTFKYYHKEGGDKIEKLTGVKSGDTYNITHLVNNVEKKYTLDKDKTIDLLTKARDKDKFGFIVSFIKNTKEPKNGNGNGNGNNGNNGNGTGSEYGTRKKAPARMIGGDKIPVRTVSRKGSKRKSKKMSRKGSRRGSKKGSKGGSINKRRGSNRFAKLACK